MEEALQTLTDKLDAIVNTLGGKNLTLDDIPEAIAVKCSESFGEGF